MSNTVNSKECKRQQDLFNAMTAIIVHKSTTRVIQTMTLLANLSYSMLSNLAIA